MHTVILTDFKEGTQKGKDTGSGLLAFTTVTDLTMNIQVLRSIQEKPLYLLPRRRSNYVAF